MIEQFLTYAINNLAAVAAGGLLAVWLAWRVWGKVQATMAATPTPGALVFWVVRLVVVVYMIFWAGRLIYGNVSAAVTAFVNSPSTVAAANVLVSSGGLLDGIMNPEFSYPSGGGGQLVSIPAPVEAQPSQASGAVSFVSQPAPAPAAQAAPVITTNEQAVAAINALSAKDDAQTRINQFVADNMPADATIACGGSYTIKSGDSLAKIAKACYGNSNQWRRICNANRLADCNNVRAGIVLVIPGADGNTALVQGQIPQSFGQQPTTYQARPTPVFVAQPAQQAAAPVRNLATGDTVVTSNSDAVAAVQALAPAQPVAQPTARPAYILAEVLGKPATGGGQAYIDQFLKTQTNNTVADAGQ